MDPLRVIKRREAVRVVDIDIRRVVSRSRNIEYEVEPSQQGRNAVFRRWISLFWEHWGWHSQTYRVARLKEVGLVDVSDLGPSGQLLSTMPAFKYSPGQHKPPPFAARTVRQFDSSFESYHPQIWHLLRPNAAGSGRPSRGSE